MEKLIFFSSVRCIFSVVVMVVALLLRKTLLPLHVNDDLACIVMPGCRWSYAIRRMSSAEVDVEFVAALFSASSRGSCNKIKYLFSSPSFVSAGILFTFMFLSFFLSSSLFLVFFVFVSRSSSSFVEWWRQRWSRYECATGMAKRIHWERSCRIDSWWRHPTKSSRSWAKLCKFLRTHLAFALRLDAGVGVIDGDAGERCRVILVLDAEPDRGREQMYQTYSRRCVRSHVCVPAKTR